jgi:hypothetical protein
MLNIIEPGDRHALAVVAVLTLLSLGMLGVIIPAPSAAPAARAQAPTPYSADHAAIADAATEERAPTF